VLDQALDEYARVVGFAIDWLTAHCTNPADAERMLAERSGEFVPLRAGQYVIPFDERVPSAMARRPRRLLECSIEHRECPATEALMRRGIRRIQDTLEHGAFSAYDARHPHDAVRG
jgi:hypothetical protein